MNDRIDESGLQVVYAEDIVKELRQGSKDPKRLRNKAIRGKFALGDLVMEAPLEIRNCCFEGEVDLRYCEFQHVVDFSGCTFRKEFNSGDSAHSLTIYRKDLICNGVRFENAAYFNGIRVEGDDYFVDSCFELEGLDMAPHSQGGSGYTVDFTNSRFAYELVCDGATFKGPVTFKAIECGGSGSFDRCLFITETRIRDGAEINFYWATFGRNVSCREAAYSAEVTFRSVECGYDASFTRSRFAEDVDLRGLKVGRDLDLRWTYWAKRVKLGRIQIPERLLLGGACFRGAVELYNSSIGVLELWDSNYPEGLPITVRNTEEDLLKVVVNKNHLELEEFAWSERQAERLTNRLRHAIHRFIPFLRDSNDQNEADNLVEKLFPFRLRDVRYLTGLNLTGTTFERFHGGPSDILALRLAMKLGNDQDPTKFSIDPYLHLETNFRRLGDEVYARALYYEGRCARRRNAKSPNGRTLWSGSRFAMDGLLKWVTGYGVRARRCVIPLILLIVLGTIVFWQDEALLADASATPHTSATTTVPSTGPYSDSVVHRSWERFSYSADLALPTVNLQGVSLLESSAAHELVPQGLVREMYAVAHQVAGQLLILLFIATLFGYVKRW